MGNTLFKDIYGPVVFVPFSRAIDFLLLYLSMICSIDSASPHDYCEALKEIINVDKQRKDHKGFLAFLWLHGKTL